MPQGWELRVLCGSKTLALGFAMASHLLRILVFFLSRKCHLLFTSDACIQVHFILDFIIKPTGGIQTPVGTTNNIIR